MFLFIILFVIGSFVNGLSFETAGMALLGSLVGSFVIPFLAVAMIGLIGYVADLWSAKRGV